MSEVIKAIHAGTTLEIITKGGDQVRIHVTPKRRPDGSIRYLTACVSGDVAWVESRNKAKAHRED